MTRIKFIFIFAFIFLGQLNAQTPTQRRGYLKDFEEFRVVSAESDWAIQLGDYIELNSIMGNLISKSKWQNKYGMQYVKYLFPSLEVDASNAECEEKRIVFIISLKDKNNQNIKTAKLIGMRDEKTSVIKKYGEPFKDIDNYLYYYNDDFDYMEIRFRFDKNNLIDEIIISMGT